LKGALSKSMPLREMKKKLGHKLPKIWEAFKAQLGDSSLSKFDALITSLNTFEDVLYPDKLIAKGAERQLTSQRRVRPRQGAWEMLGCQFTSCASKRLMKWRQLSSKSAVATPTHTFDS
jgi:hypothetical protein